MTEVFMPLNMKIEEAIVENSHLIDGVEMPKPFLDVLAHIEVYKAIVKKWENDDYSDRASYVNWPEEFAPYVCQVYEELKFKQAKIMSDIDINHKPRMQNANKARNGKTVAKSSSSDTKSFLRLRNERRLPWM